MPSFVRKASSFNFPPNVPFILRLCLEPAPAWHSRSKTSLCSRLPAALTFGLPLSRLSIAGASTTQPSLFDRFNFPFSIFNFQFDPIFHFQFSISPVVRLQTTRSLPSGSFSYPCMWSHFAPMVCTRWGKVWEKKAMARWFCLSLEGVTVCP